MRLKRFWGQAGAIARRDLLIEGRAGEVLSVVIPFAAVAVFVVPLATDTLERRLADLAAPVYWLVALLFGMQVSLRQTAVENQTQRRILALTGADPAARFVGRSAAAALLTLAVLTVTAPLVILFYQPPVEGLATMIPIVGLFAAGLAMLSTLAGDVTVGLRTRSALAPLLVAPLSVPLIIGASQALESLAHGRGTLTWTLLLIVTDLSLAVTGVLTARHLEEATL